MKSLITILLILSFTISFAQTRTTTFEGRTVKVFPYKLESEYEYYPYKSFDEFRTVLNEFSIPFAPEKLEDGEYLIYYSENQFYYDRTNRRKRRKLKKYKDSLIVAAVFNLKNNVKDGPVAFYKFFPDSKPIATGFYKNDLKDGVWITQNSKEKISIEYKAGIIEGKIVRENLRYQFQTSKTIRNGREVFEDEPFPEVQIIYQKKPVTISKYRITYGETGDTRYQNDTFLTEDFDVDEMAGRFTDGEYLIYYKPIIDLDNERSLNQLAKQKEEYIALDFTVKNGKLEGKLFEFEFGEQSLKNRNNKSAKICATYKNGVLNGGYTNSNKNTKYTSIANYSDGKLNGNVVSYRKGKIERIVRWKDGLREGKEEHFQKGKLVRMSTWKNGVLNGPFLNAMDINYTLCGIHNPSGVDSIIEVNFKNQYRYRYTKSLTPFEEMDTSELGWYLMPVLFAGNQHISLSIFTKYQKLSLDGKVLSTEYLYKGCRKIPFVKLNEQGDTLVVASRINNDSTLYKSELATNYFDKDGKIQSTSILHFSYNNSSKFSKSYLSKQVSWTYYYSDSIITKTIFDNPKSLWNGWLTKIDSTITTYTNSNKKKINETYDIKNLGQFRDVTSPDPTGFTVLDYGDNKTYRFIAPDTMLITTSRNLHNYFNYTTSVKKCLTDSTYNTYAGGAYNVNPLDLICHEWQNTNTDIDLYNLNKNNLSIRYLTGRNRSLLMHEGIPFTGKVFVNHTILQNGIPNKNNVELVSTENGIYINYQMHKSIFKCLFKPKKNSSTRHFEYQYSDGLLHGTQRCWEDDSTLIYSLNFNNGTSQGKQTFQEYGAGFLKIVKTNYDNGVQHGDYLATDKFGNEILKTRYEKGKLQGKYVEYDKYAYRHGLPKKPIIQANFVNDSLDGPLTIFKNGTEKEKITFVNGQATGLYFNKVFQYFDEYQSDSAHDFKPYYHIYLDVKTNLINGAIRDTVWGYFPEGGLKYIAVMDTDFHHKYLSQRIYNQGIVIQKELAHTTEVSKKYNPNKSSIWPKSSRLSYLDFSLVDVNNFGINLDPLYENVKAIFTFYYKSGAKAQQGKMVNNTKYGHWKYWAENGVLMKEIDYEEWLDSTKTYHPNFIGKIATYYPNGKKLMEGFIVSEELSYECNQELEIANENVMYSKFYNKNGENIFNYNNFQVIEFHINGNKRYIGQIANGQNAGLWKFYDPTGNLKAIGEYVNGKRDGRWLEGDLGGVNYVDNACSINEALSILKERLNRNIDVIESIYQNGVLISSSHQRLEKY